MAKIAQAIRHISPGLLDGLLGYIETGCAQGDSLLWATRYGFSTVAGCDASIEMCKQARVRTHPLANIVHADSESFLRSILTFFPPSLIFLDAHFETDSPAWPLYEELELIAANRRAQDAIICDDIRCIADVENPRWIPGEVGEYEQFGRTIEEYRAVLDRTHTSRVLSDDEGYLIFEPRETSPLGKV